MDFRLALRKKFSEYPKKRLLIVGLLLLSFSLGLYIWNNFLPTQRGSEISYVIRDRYNDQEKTEKGRIIALPGESVRFNFQNDQIYIKKDGQSFKLKETYLSQPSTTLSLKFNDGWHTLGSDELFVLKDRRSIETMDDFVYVDNIIKQSQIISTQKTGRRSDIVLQPIDEKREFAVKVSKQWLGWQAQIDEPINIKNNAVPVVKAGLAFIPTIGNKLVVLDAENGHKKWETSFSTTVLRITPDESNLTVSVWTNDNVTTIFDSISGNKIAQDNSVPVDNLPTVQPVVDQDDHFKIEKLGSQIRLTKNDDTGKVIWRYISNDVKFFPDRFNLYGEFLIGMGGYGGNYMEDVGYKSSVYVINANTGKLVTVKSNLRYANFDVIENILLIYDEILQGYDLTTGKLIWSYPIRDDSGSNCKDWIVDQENQVIYAADKSKIVALRKDSSLVWLKEIESTTPNLNLKNGVVYFLDQGRSSFYALDRTNGNTLWQINTTNPSAGPHITDQNQVFFKNLSGVKFQFTETEFLTLDPLKKTPIKIFDYITLSDNDMLFQYEKPYIFVFTNDFVTAIKYQPD
jgi:outer membrane protein assembly factor BamB